VQPALHKKQAYYLGSCARPVLLSHGRGRWFDPSIAHSKRSLEVSISMLKSHSPLAKLLTVLPLFASYEILPAHE